jgi:CRP/FNR family transcriptional regulator
MDERRVLILDNPLFSRLDQNTISDLAQGAVLRKFSAQEIIVHQEQVWPYLFLIAEGKIHAVKESLAGRALIATTINPGEIFWGLAFFIRDAPMPVMLQATTETCIYLWSRESLEPVIRQHGDMSWTLCQVMISRMQLASEIVEDLAFQPVMGRLAGLILDEFGEAGDKFVTRQLTLEEMAARIGTTREMVCRHLYRFAEKGAIQINRTELRITNREKLLEQAGK